MHDSYEPPTANELVSDLRWVREKGVPQLRRLDLPALRRAAQLALDDENIDDHARAETLLRRAIVRLGGGAYGESALALFGLDKDGREFSAGVRRARAAAVLSVSITTFRKKRELPLLEDIAVQVLSLCAEQHARTAHLRRTRRSLVDSTMAVEVLRRFESYYGIWSSVSGIASDLVAYRFTLFEAGRPYDRRFGTRGSDDHGNSQEEQAEGYARYALYHFAHYEWKVRQFDALNGGLWLGSNDDTDQALADTAYEISYHSPFNERDRSLLRSIIAETPDQELHGFLERLASTEIGRETHREWQEWVSMCECTWGESHTAEYAPMAANHPGISESCEVHLMIAACAAYCELVDLDWRRVADWYHIDTPIPRPLGPKDDLYQQQLERRLERETDSPPSSGATDADADR